MADYNKIGLLALSQDSKRMLLLEEYEDGGMLKIPGGRPHRSESEMDTLTREVFEEIGVKLDKSTLMFIGEFIDITPTDRTKTVSIRLYRGTITGEPVPKNEVKQVLWLSMKEMENYKLTPIVANKIVPALIERKILK